MEKVVLHNQFEFKHENRIPLCFGDDYIMLRYSGVCLGCVCYTSHNCVLRVLGGKVNVVVLIEGQYGQCCSSTLLQELIARGATIIITKEVKNMAGVTEGIRVYDQDAIHSFPTKFVELLARTHPVPA